MSTEFTGVSEKFNRRLFPISLQFGHVDLVTRVVLVLLIGLEDIIRNRAISGYRILVSNSHHACSPSAQMEIPAPRIFIHVHPNVVPYGTRQHIGTCDGCDVASTMRLILQSSRATALELSRGTMGFVM